MARPSRNLATFLPWPDARQRRQRAARSSARPADKLPYVQSPPTSPSDPIGLPRHPTNWRYGPTGDRIERARITDAGIDGTIARTWRMQSTGIITWDTAGRRHHRLIAERDGRAVI